MRETAFLAAMFLLLALAGLEPGHAEAAKTCRVGPVADWLGGGC